MDGTMNDGKNLSFVWLMHRKLCSFVAMNMTKTLNGIRTGFSCALCVTLAQSLAQLCPGADRAPPSNFWHSLGTGTLYGPSIAVSLDFWRVKVWFSGCKLYIATDHSAREARCGEHGNPLKE